MDFGRGIAAGIIGSVVLAAPAAAVGDITLYQCADGAQFALAFYDADTHAYIQINGKSVALPKRLSLSGARYSASGITLRINKDVTTLKRPREALTTCKQLHDW